MKPRSSGRLAWVAGSGFVLLALLGGMIWWIAQDDRDDRVGTAAGLPSLGVTIHLEEWTDDDRRAQFARLAQMGSTWVRVGLPWYAFQPESPEVDERELERLDRIVSDATSNGLHVLFIGDQPPSWADVDEAGTTSRPDAYAAFMAIVSEHFRNRGPDGASPAYELMNEPNGQRSDDGDLWAPAVDYAITACAAYKAIKAADGGAVVAVGSLDVTDWESWLRTAFRSGLRDCFDVLSVHVYADMGVLAEVRDVARDEGRPEVEIWLTEFGASTCPEPEEWCVSEALQAQRIVERILDLQRSYPWVPIVMIYQDQDEPNNPRESKERHFGLYRVDDSGALVEKPAVAALRDLYRPA